MLTVTAAEEHVSESGPQRVAHSSHESGAPSPVHSFFTALFGKHSIDEQRRRSSPPRPAPQPPGAVMVPPPTPAESEAGESTLPDDRLSYAEPSPERTSYAEAWAPETGARNEPPVPLALPQHYQLPPKAPPPAAHAHYATPVPRGPATARTRSRTNSPSRRLSSSPAVSGSAAAPRGFGNSTPRFDLRYDPAAKAAAKAAAHAAQQQAQQAALAALPEHANSVTRARGLHAAYAQCAALRRMLTALRINRLLVRWRVAVVFIAANERLAQVNKPRMPHATLPPYPARHSRSRGPPGPG